MFLHLLHCYKLTFLSKNHQRNLLLFSHDRFCICFLCYLANPQKSDFQMVLTAVGIVSVAPQQGAQTLLHNQDIGSFQIEYKAYLEESHGCSIFNCTILYLCLLGQIISRINRGFHTFHCQKGG